MDTALLDFLSIAPMLVCANKLAELRSVIAEVVDADRLISEKVENAIECAAQNGRREMPDMKGLCDIDRRIVDTNRFPLSLVARAVIFPFVENPLQHVLGKFLLIDFKIKITVDCRNFLNFTPDGKYCFKLLCDRDRAFS